MGGGDDAGATESKRATWEKLNSFHLRLDGGAPEDEGKSGSLARFIPARLAPPRLLEDMFGRRGELRRVSYYIHGKGHTHHRIPSYFRVDVEIGL